MPTSSTEDIAIGSTRISPWSVLQSASLLSSQALSPPSGTHSIELRKISQTISTIPGAKYTLSFFFRYNSEDYTPVKISIGQTTYEAKKRTRSWGWELNRLDFVASSSTTEIILSTSDENITFTTNVDEITVTLSSIFLISSVFLFYFFFFYHINS